VQIHFMEIDMSLTVHYPSSCLGNKEELTSSNYFTGSCSHRLSFDQNLSRYHPSCLVQFHQN